MEKFTKEEAMQNINSLKELIDTCRIVDDSEPIPFTVRDAKLMCGLIYHLAIEAKYITGED